MKLRLDEMLTATGVSQRELAKRMDCSRANVSHLIRERRCTMKRLLKIARALKVPERELVEFER